MAVWTVAFNLAYKDETQGLLEIVQDDKGGVRFVYGDTELWAVCKRLPKFAEMMTALGYGIDSNMPDNIAAYNFRFSAMTTNGYVDVVGGSDKTSPNVVTNNDQILVELQQDAGFSRYFGNVYLLINDDYVDYVVNPGTELEHEVNNLMDLMDGQGIAYSTFTSLSASTFDNMGSASKLLIPELEEDDILPGLNSGAKAAIANYVSRGGTLITFEPDSGDLINFLNEVFSFSLSYAGSDEPITLTEDGAGLFTGLNSEIPSNNATVGLATDDLPPNAVTIYAGDGANQSTVVKIPYGSGSIYVLGWDWYDGAPRGVQDGGWNNLLVKILES